jgi:hypothetical protein
MEKRAPSPVKQCPKTSPGGAIKLSPALSALGIWGVKEVSPGGTAEFLGTPE